MSVQTEKALLGTVLQDNSIHGRVADRLTGRMFSDPALGEVFDQIGHLAARGIRVSTLTVADYFEQWEVRGLKEEHPFEWDTAEANILDVDHYADIIIDDHLRREGKRAIAEAMGGLKDITVDPVTTMTRLVTQLQNIEDDAQWQESTAKPLADVLAGDADYHWVIPGLLERGDRLIVTGNEGGGKTTFLRQLALCAGAGIHPFTKTKTDVSRVLIIDAENNELQWKRTARWMVNRVLALGGQPDMAKRIMLDCTRRLDVTRANDLAYLHRQVDRHKPDIVMIGPLYRLIPRAVMTDDDAAPLLSALDSLRDRGLTLVMEAHAGKSNDSDGDRNMQPRGSSALLGWPEFGFGLRPLKTDPAFSALVKWRGDRDQRSWPEHVYRGGDLPWTAAAL